MTTATTTDTTAAAATDTTAATTDTALAAPGLPPSARVQVETDTGWTTVCEVGDLLPGRGVAALLPDGTQIAVFLDRTGGAHAIANRDPFTGAYVLSRGLLGSAQGRPFVASPLLKQRFDLASGRCLDDDAVTVRAYAVRVG
ncbi:nitrite reductase small subunit NirD [Streptomyces sp. JJ66]|uniref:nitrite reductase small subunit NirD n=1 Tax=Streptomyces sp. JJ66 TaxID=2803843 RepID=UPI001C590EE3|nr:nitrite reductase small subunit NirD [Streptomyces sp. JJ66]MBW1601009.1 nitrite reductase small subunit NirD [Streptomyces sp. JJ66]